MERARIIEAYVGEYASGKSEVAINRALELKNLNHSVNLVDLDTVEPFYTLRPIKEILEEKGLKVISFSRQDSFGLGETGAMLNPQARWALRLEGDVIFDVGYGVHGANTLNLVEGAADSKILKVLAVVNYMRPMTNSVSRIIEYINGLGKIHAIVANTHLGDDTTLELVINGNNKILEAANLLGIPVSFAVLDEKFKEFVSEEFPLPVKFIKRYMPAAIW